MPKRSAGLAFSSLQEFTNCAVDENCRIVCTRNGETWYPAASLEDLPVDLRNEYLQCQQNEHLQHVDDEEYEDKEEEEDVMAKLGNKLEDMTQSKDLDRTELEDLRRDAMAHGLRPEEAISGLNRRQRRRWICGDNSKTLDDMKQKVPFETEFLRRAIAQVMDIPEVRFIEILGQGVDGITLLICNPSQSNEKVVVKIKLSSEISDAQFETEFQRQEEFYRAGLAPKPMFLRLSRNDDLTLMVMGKLDGVLSQFLERELTEDQLTTIVQLVIANLFSKMCERRLSHNDLHWSNLGYVGEFVESDEYEGEYQNRMKLQLIDFTYAKNDGCDIEAELIQLIRTTFPFGRPPTRAYEQNMLFLRRLLLQKLEHDYGSFPKSIRLDDWQVWESLHFSKINELEWCEEFHRQYMMLRNRGTAYPYLLKDVCAQTEAKRPQRVKMEPRSLTKNRDFSSRSEVSQTGTNRSEVSRTGTNHPEFSEDSEVSRSGTSSERSQFSRSGTERSHVSRSDHSMNPPDFDEDEVVEYHVPEEPDLTEYQPSYMMPNEPDLQEYQPSLSRFQ